MICYSKFLLGVNCSYIKQAIYRFFFTIPQCCFANIIHSETVKTSAKQGLLKHTAVPLQTEYSQIMDFLRISWRELHAYIQNTGKN